MIERIEVKFPRWIDGLELNNDLKVNLFENMKKTFCNVKRLKDINECYKKMEEVEEVKNASVEEINLGNDTGLPTGICYRNN